MVSKKIKTPKKCAGVIIVASIIFLVGGAFGISKEIGLLLNTEILSDILELVEIPTEIIAIIFSPWFAVFRLVVSISCIVAGIGLLWSKKWAGILGISVLIIELLASLPALAYSVVFTTLGILYCILTLILILIGWKGLT